MSQTAEKAQDRLDILKKIKELEIQGKFDVDVENDPPTIELKPNEIDYKRKKLINKIKRFFVYRGALKMVKKMQKNGVFQIKEYIGLENMKSVKSGAIVTCNHFSPAESFAMDLTFRQAKLKKKKLFRVIREGNYTNPPPAFASIMRHCNTLPLSQNKETMKKFMRSTNELIKEGNFILIYPEESLWWNYKKPRPFKVGAFRFAVKNNVPVIPIFITMEDSDVVGPDGFPVQAYTVHVEKPIYPNRELSQKEQMEEMKNKNFEIWKNIYEKTYKIPLVYDTIITEDTEDVVKKYAKK